MKFNFRHQTPNVAYLLHVCNGVLANLQGMDKVLMEAAMRAFEDSATVMELQASRVGTFSPGDQLAKSEVRLVLDLAAGLITAGSTLDTKLEKLVDKVKSLRAPPGSSDVRELSATPGRAWVSLHRQLDGTCSLTAWDGSSKPPLSEDHENYALALDRADELAAAIHERRGQAIGATGEVAWIVVPRSGTQSEKVIDPRSGVVAKRKGDQVMVYYEGNRMGAENLRRYAERVSNAAGRLFQRYPTVAKSAYSLADFLSQFQIVGYCTDAYEIEIHDKGTVLAYAGKPGMSVPSGEAEPYLMNDHGEWKKGAVTVSRQDVALAHQVDHFAALAGAL